MTRRGPAGSRLRLSDPESESPLLHFRALGNLQSAQAARGVSRVSSSRPRGRGQCGTRAADLQPTRAHARAQAREFDLLPRSGTVVVLVSGAACWLLGRPGNTPGPSHSAAPALTEGCDHPEPTRGDSEQHRTGCALHGPDHDRKRSALPVGVPASLDPARGGGRLNLGASPLSSMVSPSLVLPRASPFYIRHLRGLPRRAPLIAPLIVQVGSLVLLRVRQ